MDRELEMEHGALHGIDSLNDAKHDMLEPSSESDASSYSPWCLNCLAKDEYECMDRGVCNHDDDHIK
jgi:hypothetical protein